MIVNSLRAGISNAQNVQFLKDFADFVTIECAVEQNASALLKIGSLPVAPGIKNNHKKVIPPLHF